MSRLLLAAVVALTACHAASPLDEPDPQTFYVATDGNDAWSGAQPRPNAARTDGPFASLEGARNALRTHGVPRGGAIIDVRPGDYTLTRTFELTRADSGTAIRPVFYRAERGVRLLGGRKLETTPVTDPGVLARLPTEARPHVVTASAPAADRLLVFNGASMPFARWPNEGFVTIADVGSDAPIEEHGARGNRTARFVYEGDRPARWVDETDAWLHGYWFWDWADERERIEHIDPSAHSITLAPPYHQYGYRKGQWFYAYNLLSELDRPGEWYVDRNAHTIVFWPPQRDGELIAPEIETLISIHDAEFLIITGFELAAARGTAITVDACSFVTLARLTIHGVGGWGIRASGHHLTIGNSTISDTGDGGIALDGGDRAQLLAANNVITNSEIHDTAQWHRMHEPAIALSGVGNTVKHVHIHDVPHEAINLRGNDHRIELSEIDHACTESNDAGAIYGGRDWTMRGTVIENNFVHDIAGFRGRGAAGVYLDDLWSGTQVRGNLFARVPRAVFVGGGRDNVIENNMFIDCSPALHVDARGLTWAAPAVSGVLRERLSDVPITSPVWRGRYPTLPGLLADSPGAPKGNMIARNVLWRGRWDEIDPEAAPLLHFVDNFLTGDPGFVDADHDNFELRADSPVFAHGIRAIPQRRIGLHR